MSREPLTDLRPPKAPPALRQRVLLAARRAAAGATEITPLDRLVERLWGSRPLRLAFGVAVVALVVAHLGLQLEGGRERPAAPSALAIELGVEPRRWFPEPAVTLATYHPTEKLEALGL